MAAIESLSSRTFGFSSLWSHIHQSPVAVRQFFLRIFKKPTFLLLHWVYFLLICLITSFLFQFLSTINISYVDSLFMVTAAMTQAGLNTIDMSRLNLFQECLTVILSMIGNPIVVSLIVIHVRKRAFQKRFKKQQDKEERRHKMSSTNSLTSSIKSNLGRFGESRVRNGFVSGVQNTIESIIRNTRHREGIYVDRNGQFYGLSLEERESVRCVEYKAVKLLGYIVIAYYVIWQLYGCLVLGVYISYNYSSLAAQKGISPWWHGVSLAIAAFNNSGISLLDTSVIPFRNSNYVLLTMSVLMLAGNTAYPIFLRVILRQIFNFIPDTEDYQDWRETLSFILKFPRRVYTNLFPSEQTMCLFGLLIFFNAFDWIVFEICAKYSPDVQTMATRSVLDGFFQTVSMRSSGFIVIPITSLFIGLQTLYVLMMYISAYPITITMRSSNVYEERSLGIYAQDEKDSVDLGKMDNITGMPTRRRDRIYFVQEQLRRQLSHDIWFLVIGALIIISTESSSYNRDPHAFSIFNFLFEIVSAYGCVGFSVGLPDKTYSFSGDWHVFSRLILCAMMLRGRHRGLPVDIDKAIQLPREQMDYAEEQDHQNRATSQISSHY